MQRKSQDNRKYGFEFVVVQKMRTYEGICQSPNTNASFENMHFDSILFICYGLTVVAYYNLVDSRVIP